jgi:hypothetical protein
MEQSEKWFIQELNNLIDERIKEIKKNIVHSTWN